MSIQKHLENRNFKWIEKRDKIIAKTQYGNLIISQKDGNVECRNNITNYGNLAVSLFLIVDVFLDRNSTTGWSIYYLFILLLLIYYFYNRIILELKKQEILNLLSN